ncbi:hypothetical protein ACJX0J_019045, partial [Zea mays]
KDVTIKPSILIFSHNVTYLRGLISALFELLHFDDQHNKHERPQDTDKDEALDLDNQKNLNKEVKIAGRILCRPDQRVPVLSGRIRSVEAIIEWDLIKYTKVRVPTNKEKHALCLNLWIIENFHMTYEARGRTLGIKIKNFLNFHSNLPKPK